MAQKISLIVARGSNGAIGLNGKMPWHIPEDLKHFKTVTMGCPVIMGRKTWDSIGRPLPGRRNIVLTRSSQAEFKGAERPEGDWIRTVLGSLPAAGPRPAVVFCRYDRR